MSATATDQRRFYRHPMHFPIHYKEAKSSGDTRTLDISEGGICFLAPKALILGRVLHIKIPVGDHVFRVKGHVAYSRPHPPPRLKRFRTGVAFANATQKFRAKLAEEMLQMKIFQQQISKALGYEVAEEEAAKRWIKQKAKRFSSFF